MKKFINNRDLLLCLGDVVRSSLSVLLNCLSVLFAWLLYLFSPLRSHLFLFSVSIPSLPLDDPFVQFAVSMVICFDGRLTTLHSDWRLLPPTKSSSHQLGLRRRL